MTTATAEKLVNIEPFFLPVFNKVDFFKQVNRRAVGIIGVKHKIFRCHMQSDSEYSVCKRYVDNWYCDTYTIQHELRDAMMLITKPEMTDSEKDIAVGKD